jgi:hypothetical protein
MKCIAQLRRCPVPVHPSGVERVDPVTSMCRALLPLHRNTTVARQTASRSLRILSGSLPEHRKTRYVPHVLCQPCLPENLKTVSRMAPNYMPGLINEHALQTVE